MTREKLLKLFPGDDELARRVRELVDQLEREHAAERDRLFTLFDEAPVFLSVLEGPEHRNTMINRRVRETPEGPGLIGKTAREVYPRENPIFALLDRVYATGVPETVHGLPPYMAGNAYDARYYTRSYVPLRDDRGDVRGILALGYEVTQEVHARHAHEESERRSQTELHRLYALLDETPVLIMVLQVPELRVEMMSRRSRELFAGRDLRGVSMRDVAPPGAPILAAVDRVLATGLPETVDVVGRYLEGLAGRSFTCTLVPIREPDGAITHIMFVAVEDTEERRARDALEEHARDLEIARRLAVDAGRAKDQFLAMLGHELRNPLAPMLTTLDVMRLRGVVSPELELLERQVRHLTRLVDDLLDVSRVTRGMIELRCQDVSIVTIVRRALEMSSPLLEQRGHRVQSELADCGIDVSADPDRLAQVVANLITNAAKYSEPGSQIRIEVRRAGDRVRLSVSDDGVGIAPEMLAAVFDAFVQQPQTLARSRGGLGLGLAIAKSLVEAHGGRVSAHSDGVGKGSTFVVELPVIDARVAPAQAIPLPAPPRPSTETKRILVVDDNYDAADILQIALEALGHTVAIAYDGPSALAAAKVFKPELGLLDIGLPEMDGYLLAEHLRAAHDIHLVAVTGYGQDSDRQRSLDAGFEAHLVKPVDLQQLARVVHQLCK